MLLHACGQRVSDVRDCVLGGESAVQKVAHRGPLHHLGPTEPRQSAEPVAAVNNVTLALLGVRNQETTV